MKGCIHRVRGCIHAGVRVSTVVTLVIVVLCGACNRAPAEPVAPARPTEALAPPPRSGEAQAPTRIAASHVLVMFRGSQSAPATVTRTRDEARARAEDVLRRARSGEDFAALARQFSDEPGAATSGGDLGMFGRGQMVPAFEQAAFALNPGQISDIVETPFGFHVIKRTR